MKKLSILVLSLLQLVIFFAVKTLLPGAERTSAVLPQRIDTHCHFIPEFYHDLLLSLNVTAGGGGLSPTWNAADHLALNDQFGIVKSIVSISTPGAKIFPDDPVEEGRTLARQLNECGYNLSMEYPDRFWFYATLTLPDLDGAVAEAIYALDTLGAAGVVVLASVFGEIFGTPRYAPLYKVLNDRKAVVLIHPGNSPCPQVGPDDLPAVVVDFLLDTTRTAINLVHHNVIKDYPNIKFILSHSGGFLPFAVTRAANVLSMLENGGGPLQRPVYLEALREFYVDLAISGSESALASTTAFFDKTHITFGSDFPYYPTQFIAENTAEFLAFDLRKEVRRGIDYDNAYNLFENFLQ